MPLYRCRGCNMEPLPYKWTGKPCPGCGGFYSIVVPRDDSEKTSRRSVAALSQMKKSWMSTGSVAIDRVLGKDVNGTGLVLGSTVFLGGEPGSGKTTLALQIADGVAQQGENRVLFASNEQSDEDIGTTVQRINCTHERLEVMGNTGDVYKICDEAKAMSAKLLVVDSLQTVSVEDCDGTEGSTSQVNAVADYITAFGKREKMAIIVVSQVNKELIIAGSMKSIHACDTICYLEKWFDEVSDDDEEIDTNTRLFVVEKNRNGLSGVKEKFKLTEGGLKLIRKSRLHAV